MLQNIIIFFIVGFVKNIDTWFDVINNQSLLLLIVNNSLLVLAIDMCSISAIKRFFIIFAVLAKNSTFHFVKYLIRLHCGLPLPPLPEPERERKEREQKERANRQETKKQQHATNLHFIVLGAALFAITLYLGYHFSIELSLEKNEGADYVTKFGDEYLDYYYGDRKEISYEYNNDKGKYVAVVEDIWTDDELDEDDDFISFEPTDDI